MNDKEYDKQVKFVLGRIREERLKANMSQIELSFEAGLSQNQINCIESGKNIPNLMTLIKICDALNIRPESFFVTTDIQKEKLRTDIISLIKKL